MPRIRYIKPDFFTDEHIAELSMASRIVFQGLWCLADREGRLEYRPKYLKVAIMPYDNINMEKLIAELSEAHKPFIGIYDVDGKQYIQIFNFLKHQKPHHTEKDSVIPPYKEDGKIKGMGSDHEAGQKLVNRHLTVKKQLPEDFSRFWAEYPRRVGRDKALEAWNKANPPIDRCLHAIKWQKTSDQWIKDGGQYIPHPTTWINQGRWNDIKPGHKFVRCSGCGIDGSAPEGYGGTPLCPKCHQEAIAAQKQGIEGKENNDVR